MPFDGRLRGLFQAVLPGLRTHVGLAHRCATQESQTWRVASDTPMSPFVTQASDNEISSFSYVQTSDTPESLPKAANSCRVHLSPLDLSTLGCASFLLPPELVCIHGSEIEFDQSPECFPDESLKQQRSVRGRASTVLNNAGLSIVQLACRNSRLAFLNPLHQAEKSGKRLVINNALDDSLIGEPVFPAATRLPLEQPGIQENVSCLQDFPFRDVLWKTTVWQVCCTQIGLILRLTGPIIATCEFRYDEVGNQFSLGDLWLTALEFVECLVAHVENVLSTRREFGIVDLCISPQLFCQLRGEPSLNFVNEDIKVSPAHVSNVAPKSAKKKRTAKVVQRKAKMIADGESVRVADLLAAQRFVESVGGIESAKTLLTAIEKLAE